MSLVPRLLLGLLGLLGLLTIAPAAVGQRRSAVPQGAYVRVQASQFRNTGDLDTLATYDFDALLLGIGYERGGLHAGVAYGRAGTPAGDVGILDVDLATSDTVPLPDKAPASLTVPLRLGFSYRRVQLSGSRAVTDFEVTTLGLAGGLAARTRTRRTTLEAAVLVGGGLATRNFDGTPGLQYTGEAHAGLQTPLTDRLGLMAGYRFRFRQWNLGEGAFGLTRQRDLYDYRALEHGLHLGLTF